MDIKKTLNLPQTDFPMRGKLPEREPSMVKFWENEDIYKKALRKREGNEQYILHDGPPYANNNIHLGQALNKVVKDVTVKYKMLKGYYAPYRPGWDTHGMPIENIVIKEFNHKREFLKIRKRCREFASEWVKIQKEEFKRLGVLGEWDNPYITMSKEYEGNELEIFADIVDKGFVYRGYMPVHWCPTCETALAISEIEYEKIDSPSITFTMDNEDYKALVWTTTPWTLISNLALAVHPDHTYVIVNVENEKYLLALDLLEENAEKIGWNDFRIEKQFKGKELENLKFKHPFRDRESRVLLATFVTMDEGTGVVHIAPGHGREDFILGQKYDIGIMSPVNEQGKFTDEAPDFEDMNTEEASKRVIDILENDNHLLHLETIEHNYPICWRCKEPLIFRATDQWFLSVDHRELRDRALEKVSESRWYPPQSEPRITAAIKERPDWCLSRQRIWGVNIPAFFCQNCGEPLLDSTVIRYVADIFKKEGADAWYEKSTEELIPENTRCSSCNESDFEKGMDILDVWFDSGVSSHMALSEDEWPSNLYLEGPDQHRGWFNSSLMLSLAYKNKAPFDTVVTHGWVLDEEGQSMHKSLGNWTSPQEIIDKYGADVLRLWISSMDWTMDVKYGPEIINRTVDAYRKIRNTFRFMLGNLYDFSEKDALDKKNLLPFDRYILIKLEKLLTEVDEEYNSFSYHRVYREIYNFITVKLSSFYMDIIKDRLYVEGKNSRERKSAQTVLFSLAKSLSIVLSPVLSFTCEEVWEHLNTEEESVFMADFPDVKKHESEEKELEKKIDNLMKAREEFHRALEPAQEDNYVGNSLEVRVEIKSDMDELREFIEHLSEFFIVSGVKFVDDVDGDYIYSGDTGTYSIKKAEGKKCQRCWMYSTTVGENEEYPELGERCIKIIKGG